MTFSDTELAALTPDHLRERGGLKWTDGGAPLGMWVAEMDFGLAPAVEEALQRGLHTFGTTYAPSHLVAGWQEAFVDFAAIRWNWLLEADQVRPLPSVLSGLRAALELFFEPGPVVVLTPAYMPFIPLVQDVGREVMEVPLAFANGRYELDLAELEVALSAGARTVIFCSPHNPVGRVWEQAELEALAEVVQRYGARVFSDEIHSPLVYPGHTHLPYANVNAATAAHTVTATAASKAFNVPGLKAAQFVLTNPQDRALWQRVGKWVEMDVGTSGLIAATAAFKYGSPWLAGLLDELDGNRDLVATLVAEHLPQVGYVKPEGTYLAWLDMRSLKLADPAQFFKSKAGVALTPGSACGEAGQGFVRLNFATSSLVIREAITAMGAAIKAA